MTIYHTSDSYVTALLAQFADVPSQYVAPTHDDDGSIIAVVIVVPHEKREAIREWQMRNVVVEE